MSHRKVRFDEVGGESAEEALRRSEERFRLTTCALGVTLFQQDADLRYTWLANPMAGYSIEGAVGRSEDEVEHTIEDVPALVRAKRRVLETGEGERIEVVNRLADGGRRWHELTLQPVRDGRGEVVGLLGAGVDVTDRKRAEEALALSEERFRLMVQGSPDIVLLQDLDFRYTWVSNPSPRGNAEIIGKQDSDFLDPEQAARLREIKCRVIETGHGERVETRLPVGDLECVYESAYEPRRDAEGRIIGLVSYVRDITERKRVEEALKEADRRKDEFLATLAHELRNPLAPIRNSVQILRTPRLDPAIAERAGEMMERQVQHLVRLVDDLLDVSRVMRGKIVLRREPVDLARVIARAVETADPLIDAQGHELSLDLTPGPLPMEADPVRLAQIVGNLLINAARYTEPGGRIRVTAGREGNAAVLRVQDSGIGIAPDMLPRVFDLFVQADHATTKAQGGLGIGLTLVQSLVELHGGTVEARSDGLGRGSTFTVRLPLTIPTGLAPGDGESDRAEVPGSSPSAPTCRRRLMVVDDNEDAAESLAMLLRSRGHEVRVAYGGREALALLDDYLPDLIFLDLGMPDMDGCEVARRIRRRTGLEGVRLAALTGWGQHEDRRRTAEAGFDHHLVKPADLAALEVLLAELTPR